MILVARWRRQFADNQPEQLSEVLGFNRSGSDLHAILLHDDGKIGQLNASWLICSHMTRAQLKRERALILANKVLT